MSNPRIDPAFSAERLPYTDGPSAKGLDVGYLSASPLLQFRAWYAEAKAAGVTEPNAMSLATVGADGAPSARTVLLKNADEAGFSFFTNYDSRKGTELSAHPVAALVFPWLLLHRQVGVRGVVSRVGADETAAYFGSRPWGSRIGAWASRQSAVVGSRDVFERRYDELAARWPDTGRPDDVPVPPFWGGFRLRPWEIEFWQGRPSRLHDRLVFVAPPGTTPLLDDVSSWSVERREP